MIELNTKFEDEELTIDFRDEDLEGKSLIISISDDVDFKELVDYLITIIPNQNKIAITNEEIPDVENADKLRIIQETVNEIIEEFNSSVDGLIEEEQAAEQEEQDNGDDDLPF